MILPQYSAWKTAAVTISWAITFFALNPTTTVALIGSATSIIVIYMNHRFQKNMNVGVGQIKDTVIRIEVNTNHTLTELRRQLAEKGIQLQDKSNEAARSEGFREGSESERDITK